MEKEETLLRTEFIRLLKQMPHQDWATLSLVIEAPPTSNKGYNMSPDFKDSEQRSLGLFFKADAAFNNALFDLIFKANQHGRLNQVSFTARRNDPDQAVMETAFNQEIEDRFENNLPKSKRGKTVPWFKS